MGEHGHRTTRQGGGAGYLANKLHVAYSQQTGDTTWYIVLEKLELKFHPIDAYYHSHSKHVTIRISWIMNHMNTIVIRSYRYNTV